VRHSQQQLQQQQQQQQDERVMIESVGCYGNDSFNNAGDHQAPSIAPTTRVIASLMLRGLA